MKRLFLVSLLITCTIGLSGAQVENLSSLLSPDVPIDAIPKDIALPDNVLPYLRKEFSDSIGKKGSFDVQFKIVYLITKITNQPSKKYDVLEEIVLWEVKGSSKSVQKTIIVSPDARVLAINEIAKGKNPKHIETLLTVIERDTTLQPRIAAAKVLSSFGEPNLTVPRLVFLLKNQYGASRAKFSEYDTKRFEDDRVAQAIIETLGDIGDPRAFGVLLQTVLNPDRHRDETVKAAWEAMKKIKW